MNVIDSLLDSDPAIRWQVLRDLTDASADEVAAERARVTHEGWGAQLLALQGDDYDVLRALDHLPDAGVTPDDRAAEAIDFVESKRDADGRWRLEHAHHDELLVELGEREGEPSRWITLRALRVLRCSDGAGRAQTSSAASA